MTTIAQGERATNTLRAGQQLQVTVSSGSALVERFIGSTLIDKDAVSASVRYGPYTEDLQYRVTCISGLISLELDSALRASPDGSPVSGAGNRQLPRAAIIGTSIMEPRAIRQSTGFVDNGDGTFDITFAATVRTLFGEGDEVQVSQASLAANTRKAEILSITPNNLTIKVRPDASLGLPMTSATPYVYGNQSRQGNTIIHTVQSLCGGGFDVTVDASLGGAATADLLSFIDRDLVARASEIDFVVAELGGMNGVYASSNSFAVEQELSRRYIDRIASLGKPFLVLGILPRGSGTAAWTSDKLNIVTQINAWADAYVRGKGGAFINPYKASYGTKSYLDVTSADANPNLTEGSSDGVHPNSGGALVIAGPIAKWFVGRFPAADILPASAKDALLGLANANPFLNGTGGAKTGGAGATVTGNVADGCDVVVQVGAADTNVVCSLVDRTEALHGDAIGKAQRLIITTGATASHIVEFRFGGDMKASFVNGTGMYGVAAVDSSAGGTPGSGNPISLRNISLVCNAQCATSANNFIDSHGQGSHQVNRSAARQVLKSALGRFRAPQATHGAPSLARASVWIFVGPNASVCVDIGRVGCLKV